MIGYKLTSFAYGGITTMLLLTIAARFENIDVGATMMIVWMAILLGILFCGILLKETDNAMP